MDTQRWLFLVVLLALLAACGGDTGSGSAPAISYEVFTTSGGDPSYPADGQGAINRGLLRLLDRATDSSEVHIAIFDWTAPLVAERLAENLRRHAGMQASVIIDPKNYADERVPRRKAARSRFQGMICNHPDQFRIVNEENPQAGLLHTSEFSPRRQMHNKFFLFRHLSPGTNDRGDYTIAVSSANLTATEIGESNEMVVIHGDSGLYSRFLAYWQAMAVSELDFSFGTTHTFSDQHDHLAYFFPKSVPGDEVAGILRSLKSGLEQSREPAKVRIAMSIWHRCRKILAHQLVKMQREHELDVRILLKEDLDIALEVKQILDSLPEGSVRFLPSRNPELAYGLHSKLMLVEGPFARNEGGEIQREHLTFTGSHNWNYDAHRYNSETWIRIADEGVHATLETHWQELWEKGIDSTQMYRGVNYDSTGCR